MAQAVSLGEEQTTKLPDKLAGNKKDVKDEKVLQEIAVRWFSEDSIPDSWINPKKRESFD